MCRLSAVAFSLLLPCVAFSGTTERLKMVGGHPVVGGPMFRSQPLVEVSDLRFYACTHAVDGAPCTVVVGYVTPNWAEGQDHTVTIEIDMYEVYGSTIRLQHKGTIRAVVERPPANGRMQFSGIGPAWFTRQANGEKLPPSAVNSRAHHELRITVAPYQPPRLDHPAGQ